MERESLLFVRRIRELLPGVQKKVVLNMNQMAIFFSIHPRQTLDLRGNRTVPVAKSTNSTKRVSVSITVSADSNMLKLMIIFKGAPDRLIVNQEFWTYGLHDRAILACQFNT